MNPYSVAAEIAQFVKCDSLGTQAAEFRKSGSSIWRRRRSKCIDRPLATATPWWARAGRSDTLAIEVMPDVRVPVGKVFE
jgi:hypothetical protein